MPIDEKRQLFRHLVATVAYRGRIAVSGAPEGFATFRLSGGGRSPGELLAHLVDLLDGSRYLLQGEMVMLESPPLPWAEGVARFFTAVRELDAFLASEAPLAIPVEKLVQGPIGDALTHVGQIVLLRRAAGSPIQADSYFMADIVPGRFDQESAESDASDDAAG